MHSIRKEEVEMVHTSVIGTNVRESGSSFESIQAWVVRCSKCKKEFTSEQGQVLLFSDVYSAVKAVVKSKDWWLAKESASLIVLCSECYDQYVQVCKEDDIRLALALS
jgi:hypothetical protein